MYHNELFGLRLRKIRNHHKETQNPWRIFLVSNQTKLAKWKMAVVPQHLPSLPFCVSTTTSAPTIFWALRTSPGLCGKTMGRGDEGIAPYRNAGRPKRVGATLVVARPAGHTSVGVDAHIRPLPWAFPLRHPGDWKERAAIKATPTGIPGGPNT